MEKIDADWSICDCLISGFCSSDREFASGFLRIPPHGGHPCSWLTIPTIKARSGRATL
ncbi:hypothetical protein [Phocaeicola faecalis]|uniref:hypothetical protein n=1 Tax=Phocaeicola faecalis TaxID=2786956 RepID=UPI001F23129D|nr:hypothetical protein [Phocaeicola faecalis]